MLAAPVANELDQLAHLADRHVRAPAAVGQLAKAARRSTVGEICAVAVGAHFVLGFQSYHPQIAGIGMIVLERRTGSQTCSSSAVIVHRHWRVKRYRKECSRGEKS